MRPKKSANNKVNMLSNINKYFMTSQQYRQCSFQSLPNFFFLSDKFSYTILLGLFPKC